VNKRHKYWWAGLCGGFLFYWLLGDILGRHNFFALVSGSTSCAILAVSIGQWLGKIKPPEDPKLTSLFHYDEQ